MSDLAHLTPEVSQKLWRTHRVLAEHNPDIPEMTEAEFYDWLAAMRPHEQHKIAAHLLDPNVQLMVRMAEGKTTIFNCWERDGMTVGLVGDEVDLSPEPPSKQDDEEDDDDVSVDQQLWRRRN